MARQAKKAKKTRRRAWDKTDVAELRKHSKAKTPAKDVAKALKRTLGATAQKAMKLGLSLGGGRGRRRK